MPAKEIKELRQSGKIDEAYTMALAELEVDTSNIWAKRNMSWVLYSQLDGAAADLDAFLMKIEEVKLLELPINEDMFFDTISVVISKAARSINSAPPIDQNKLHRLFDAIKDLPLKRKSKWYSVLFSAFQKGMKESSRYIEFADWWDFDNFLEENYLKGEPIESLHTYAMTKRMLLEGVKSLKNQFGYNWLCVVPSTLYGPDYHTDGRQMHFIFDLIRKIIRAKEFGEEVVLWGDGYQSREIIHVDDFIKSLLNLIENKVENEVINIGFGEEHTIREFAKSICHIVDYDFDKISFDTSKYTGAKSKCLSIKKISKLVPGYKSSLIPLDQGIQNVVDWFYKTNSYI